MLKFEPESFEQLQARYHRALIDVYDARQEITNPPSGKREHVFDTPNGFRLIVSRDIEGDGSLYLHLSASIGQDTPLWTGISSGSISRRQFKIMTVAAFVAISRDTEPFEFCGFTKGKGVPHWRRKESEVFAPSGEAVN